MCVNLQFSVPPLGGEEYLKMSHHVTFNSLFLQKKNKKIEFFRIFQKKIQNLEKQVKFARKNLLVKIASKCSK